MLKKINRILKLVGLNLVRAKGSRRKPKSEAQRVKETVSEFWQKVPPYTPEELENAPLKCAVNKPGTVPLADYMGDAEWHNSPGPTGNVGCVPPHTEFDRQSTPCSGVSTPCGTESHEMTRAEHFDTAGGTTPEQNEARFNRPAIPQPNSDNKIGAPTS